MIIVDNLDDFNVLATYINGNLVAENGNSFINPVNEEAINLFDVSPIKENDLRVPYLTREIRVIRALEGQLITQSFNVIPKVNTNYIVSDVENDVLKIVVLNRYKQSKPIVALINGFNFKKGAIASTVAHDSHNIIAVGTNDKDITRAINLIIESKGGISLVNGSEDEYQLPLPVAGLMSIANGYEVAQKYEYIDKKARDLGSNFNAPFMTLSFMALLVIPELKVSDKGLFDGTKFEFTSIYVES
jgi:adenine deaminase